MIFFCKPLASVKRQAGTSLAIIAVVIVMMLGFTGLGIYVGMVSFIQNELQKAATTATSVGATALYDGPTQNVPVRSPQIATQSATQTYNNLRNAPFSALSRLNPQITQAPTENGGIISMQLRARFPSGFLGPLGMSNIQIDAIGRSMSIMSVVPGITVPADGTAVDVPLPAPLADGPGPDLHIVAGALKHGYSVEACSGNQCYDISPAAMMDPADPGMLVDNFAATFFGMVPRRIIYGSVYIDLAAVNNNLYYNANVGKATRLRIIDDGIHDQYIGGQRYIELVPQNATISRIEVYHLSNACPNRGACATAPGFVARP